MKGGTATARKSEFDSRGLGIAGRKSGGADGAGSGVPEERKSMEDRMGLTGEEKKGWWVCLGRRVSGHCRGPVTAGVRKWPGVERWWTMASCSLAKGGGR